MIEILVQQNGVNYQLDLNGDEQFSINWSIADINDISNSNGAYTKTINIPDTTNNRFTFGFTTDLSVDLNYNYNSGGEFPFNPNKKVKCFVLEDTITILEGYIQFVQFSYDGINNNKIIEVNIFADNVNFWNSMGDAYLTDLDFSEYNFTYSIAEIKSTWNNNPDAYKKGWYAPLVDYGNGWTLDDLNNTSVNDNVLYELTLNDFKPAVFVKPIWDKIFQTHSFFCQSQFIGSGNKYTVTYPDPRFANLVIPFNNTSFQANSTFNQDKIFHVGLTTSTLGQFSTYQMGTYQAVGATYSDATAAIVNMRSTSYFFGAVYPNVKRHLWYDGYLLSPFQQYSDRNQLANATDTAFTFDQVIIPFGLTASPMFETFNDSGAPTYNTGPAIPDYCYQNRVGTHSLFKQRFVLNTDIVTTYSNQGLLDIEPTTAGGSTASGQAFNYVIQVGFFREFDPAYGLTACPDWLGGTGFPIPADLGGVGGTLNMCRDLTGATDSIFHWVCDYTNKSNVFDKSGTLIVPTGGSRYLGKYYTSYLGDQCLESGGSASRYYKNTSGSCISFYYNDGVGQSDSHLTGLWCSGYSDNEMINNYEATHQPAYGDWYQQLNLQTIYLDNNSADPLYGAAGSVLPNSNIPIHQGERVRCVIFFGGKYHGQQSQTTNPADANYTSYKPPTSGFLLTSTNFANDPAYPYGKYQYPATQPDLNGAFTNNPLTVFFNDVSNDYIEGQYVNFNDVIPKNIKQRDFIQSITNQHNLYIEPSKVDPNTLIVEPRDIYYNLATQSLDWSSKIDLTTPIQIQVLAETQNKSTLFTYKDDKDWWNKQYTQATNEIYGQFNFQIDNDYLTDQKTIQSLFSPTPLVQLFSTFNNSGSDTLATQGGFIIPSIVSGTNQKPNTSENANGTSQYNYRILYKNYLENNNSDQIYLLGAFTHSYPYAGPYDDPYNPSYTLNWGQTLGEFFDEDTNSFPNNLVNTYWATQLTELTDMDSKLITVSMYLTPYDINNFYFYKLVFLTIDGVDGYYKVNSIQDYIPGQNSVCTVELLKTNVT